VEAVRPTIDLITSTLCSERGLNPAEFERWFEALPALLSDLAARFPDLKLPTTTGEDEPWATLFPGIVLRVTHAPAGFEEAPARRIAATLRALTICFENQPKGADGSGGAPTSPTGTPRKVGDDLTASWREAASAALAYLAQQQKDGRFGFMGREDPGITALALSAVLRTSRRLRAAPPPWVDPGLDWLVSLQKQNGAIHAGGLAVYVTSASILALKDGGRPKDHAAIERAALFLKVVQRDEGEGYDPNVDWGYGGIGYGSELRPDLSNTQFGIEGLRAAGVPADDPAMQRAILFLQRCQNDPEFNAREIERADGRIVRAGTDGGAGYQPGESKAGLVENADGTFTARSYGSMTYALLKCYLFAGLPLDDPRVKAALRWIQAHWTVELNPGFETKKGAASGAGGKSDGAEYQGLFYYYFTMARCLDASGLETIRTPDGVEHRWRDELLRKLLEISFAEGFWTNQKSSRWMEEFPTLATAYALVAMDHCLGARTP
jgi:squalene-hopene/tetraprenyl-beta-curcumene cyclase